MYTDLPCTFANYSLYRTGKEVLAPGTPCGSGLHLAAAEQLGLRVGTPVATSIIDAHAGGLGLVGCNVPGSSPDFCTRLSTYLIFSLDQTCYLLFGSTVCKCFETRFSNPFPNIFHVSHLFLQCFSIIVFKQFINSL